MMFRADLHCHTLFSDGTLTPQQIISKAKEIGLLGLSITDHDSIDAYQTAPHAAKENQILLGSGAEFSCAYEDLNIHVLAYDFDVKNSCLIAFCEKHRQRRKDRNRIILQKLKQYNMVLDEEELNGMGHMIGRPHIAKLLVQKGFAASTREAFQLYIGDHKSCYHRGPGFSIEETLSLIHEAKGKAFIAHPHLLRSSSTIRNLLKMPFDGIECHYARIPPDQERKWIKMAKDKNLLMSGGSDFHGETSDHNPLGSSWVDEENFHKIFQHLL
jgi:predicted metal-dependent phosphoesterase TrpH